MFLHILQYFYYVPVLKILRTHNSTKFNSFWTLIVGDLCSMSLKSSQEPLILLREATTKTKYKDAQGLQYLSLFDT